MESWNLCKRMYDVALKVKVFLSLNKQDAAVKTCEVEELQLHAFLTSALYDGGQFHA